MAAMKTRFPGFATVCSLCRVLPLLSLVLALSGCFSFRVNVPPAPEDMLGCLAIIHSEPAALDMDKPIDDEPVCTGDAGIIALIKVLQVSRPMTLQWQWYSPDKGYLSTNTGN